MGWQYSEKTKELFMNAVQGKPGTHLGEIENPDGVGEHGSIACGDALRFTFKVRRNEEDPRKDIIIEAKYLTFGCTSAIAASEALCCIIEGKPVTPIEALKITNDDIVEFLEGLPVQKIHCSVMGAEALQAAVFDWAHRRGVSLAELGVEEHTEEEANGRVVCKCFNITEPYLKRKIKEMNLRTIPEITGAIKAGGACMSCHHQPGGLQDILDEVWGTKKAGSVSGSGSFIPVTGIAGQNGMGDNASKTGTFIPLATVSAPVPASVPERSLPESHNTNQQFSPYQRSKKIEQVIHSYIQPLLRQDGGDIEIIDIKDMVVYVELTGACANCSGSTQTLKNLIESTLKNQVSEEIRVIQV